MDNYTRFCLDIYPDQGIKGEQVVDVLDRLKEECNAVPKKIQVDNGSEFISKVLDKWAYENKVIRYYHR